MLSFHKLLARANGRESLLSNLDVVQSERTELVNARTLIRQTLRDAISEQSKSLSPDGSSVVPKFFTQGSWAYGTLNNPTQGKQQIDMDDGCYLPLEFVKETGQPRHAARAYFEIVDTALKALCGKMKWKYIDNNPNCGRVVLNARLHIDIPLYGIDTARFVDGRLTEAKRMMSFAERAAEDDTEELGWARVKAGQVLHAKRTGEWDPSDPMVVRDWAVAVADDCEQVRSIWRYLKTWRDLEYPSGGPSSILLMVMIEQVFGVESDRDDIKLRDVVHALANNIIANVYPDWSPQENLNKLNQQQRQEAVAKLHALERLLNECFSAGVTEKDQVVARLQGALSRFIPKRADAIEEVGPYAAALATAPSSSAARPWAPNTTSG